MQNSAFHNFIFPQPKLIGYPGSEPVFGYARKKILADISVQEVTSLRFLNLAKGISVPLQAWGGPEGCRKLRFPDFVTTAQDGGRL